MHVQNTNQLGTWTFPFIVQMRGSSIWVFSFGKKGGKWRGAVPNRYTTETFSSVGLILANVGAKAWVLQAMNTLSLIACLISLINNSVQSKNQSCKVMSSGARVYSKILQNLPFMHYERMLLLSSKEPCKDHDMKRMMRPPWWPDLDIGKQLPP